jgi:hypothetical protein
MIVLIKPLTSQQMSKSNVLCEEQKEIFMNPTKIVLHQADNFPYV